jgi:hypothetical protein
MTTSTYSSPETATTHDNLWQKGLIAAVVATVINLILYAIGALMGGLMVQDMANPAAYMPVSWFMVILMTVIPVLLGTGVYWVLRRMMPNQATMIFVIGALAVALLSLFGPITMAQTVMDKMLLSAMHIVAGVSLVWFTTR